jgi:hypothetical protein
VNREFVPLFAALCKTLARYADTTVGGSAVAEASVRTGAQMLLENLAPRALGNTLLAARRLQDQAQRAVDILRDQSIGALVGARTLQQTIVNILGQDAPDVQRLIDSGLNGQAVLEWLATKLPQLSGASSTLTPLDQHVALAAVLWLRAVGVDDQQQQTPQRLAA